MTYIYGWECKLFVDSSATYVGTPATPTWEELEDVENVTLAINAETIDVSPRGAGAMKVGLPGRVEAKISGTILWRNGKAELEALRTANLTRAPLNVRALRGASTNADAKGVKGDFFISKFEEKQEGDAVKVDFELMPFASIRSNYVVADTGSV
jgi:hypothetical protein